MTDELAVLLEDRLIGTLTRRANGRLAFDYDREYRTSRGATPLSVSMPLAVPTHPDGVVAPWLWGLLPDNNSVLQRWARTFQVSLANPMNLLGTPVGEDCAGAVRFCRPEALEAAGGRDGGVDWLDERGVASRLRALQRDSTAWLGSESEGHFSLAGAQAKTALLQADGRWGVPWGSIPTSHILKPAITGFDDHDLNEHLCLRAARFAGLSAANSQVLSFENQTALVVERYDRLGGPDRRWRVHQEDICQASGLHPERKYQSEGGPSSSDIATLVRSVMPPQHAETAVWRLFDALVFNWLICGTDAHAKNYSLLLSGDQVRLAPVYDVASALPYPDMPLQKLRLAMKFGGSYYVTASGPRLWPKVAGELGLDVEQVIERAHALIHVTPEALSQAAREEQVTHLKSTMPARLVDLVSRRVVDCARTLP